MNFFYKALESKYQAKIDEAVATIELYFYLLSYDLTTPYIFISPDSKFPELNKN